MGLGGKIKKEFYNFLSPNMMMLQKKPPEGVKAIVRKISLSYSEFIIEFFFSKSGFTFFFFSAQL